MRLRVRPSLVAAVVLIALAALLAALSEARPAAQPKPEVQFPRWMEQHEMERAQARRTLPPLTSAPPSAPGTPPAGRDPFLAALPNEPGKPLVVLEANALRHSRVGELFIDCVLRDSDRDPLEEIRQQMGIDPLRDIDRVAFSSEGAVVSGFFDRARFDHLEAELQPARYGEDARIYTPRTQGGDEPDPSLAVWRNQLVVVGSDTFVTAAIDRLQGRAAVAQPVIPEALTYGEAYGVVPGTALLPLFRGDQSGLGERLAAIASRIEIHADAMRDVAVVARVTGPDATQLADLGRSIGTALAVARLGAKARGATVLADILEFAKVEPARSSFSVELALPVDVVERLFSGCRERAGESRARR